MADSALVEVGTIGNEGMVGIPVFLGATATNGMAMWQISGELLRMRSETFREEVKRGGPLVFILQRYTGTFHDAGAAHSL